jgi:hypothetical protein
VPSNKYDEINHMENGNKDIMKKGIKGRQLLLLKRSPGRL